MTATNEVALADEAATIALARVIAAELPRDYAGWTILLIGELGAGKSTLARALIHALGHTGTVPSPTYTLVEPYDLNNGAVYHIDLYRVSDPEELYFLGFDDLDSGLKVIEWPDRAPGLESSADVRVELAYAGTGRRTRLVGMSDRGAALAGRCLDLIIQPTH